MPEENLSAFAAMRALRDELRARLDQNEDYRAWKALDEVLRELEPRSVPKAVDLAHTEDSDAARTYRRQVAASGRRRLEFCSTRSELDQMFA